MKSVFYLAICVVMACSNPTSQPSPEAKANLSEKRTTVSSEPVATYDIALPDDLNHWRFTAKLYETKDRFTYKLDSKYQEITGSTEIIFPNLGEEPKPIIQPTAEKLECLVGFNDKNGNFIKYYKVSALDGQLRIRKVTNINVVPKAAEKE